MSPAVDVDSMTKRYGERVVVDALSFTVEAGEVFALLGPNGAGKTTTVEILEGYRKADSGSVRVLDLDPARERDQLRRQMGLMLQSGGLYPQITPREALRLFAAFHSDPEDPEALLRQLQLDRVASTRFRQLSGGEKQRLSLGLAMVGRPRLMFLDEPTAAMDPQARHATWTIIRDQQARGTTVLLTTHFMDEAEELANRVAIIDRGRLVALDTPARLRQAVGHELRFTTDSAVSAADVARALGIAPTQVTSAPDGGLVLSIEPTPEIVARLSAWLATRGVLLTDLRAGSRTLEHAFLELTESSQP